MNRTAIILLTLLVAVPATWFTALRWQVARPVATPDAQKSTLYQCAMHPWIQSERPGRCTICGMELVALEKESSASAANILTLGEAARATLQVRVETAKKLPLGKTLLLSGMIDDDETRHRIITAYTTGRIERLQVNFAGAEVGQGQPLAEIYSPDLLQAEREYRLLEGPLRESGALRLRQLGLSAEQIKALPGKPASALTSQILSPMGGTVVAKFVYEGQSVMEGEKLFELADFSTMWLILAVPEQDLAWLKPGQEVDASTPAQPGRVFKGQIKFIDPNLDAGTRTARVRVELPNPLEDGRRSLPHRASAEGLVLINLGEVLALPRSAVLDTGSGPCVFIDAGGGYEKRMVRLGRRGDTHVEILEGVRAGEKVVSEGNMLLDGQAEMERLPALPLDRPRHESQHGAALPQRDIAALLDDLAKDLFAQDLKGYASHLASLGVLTKGHDLSSSSNHALHRLRDRLISTIDKSTYADLKQARSGFQVINAAAMDLFKALHGKTSLLGYDIYECPMVDGVPDAPKGLWIQAKGREMANPYFGPSMKDCGSKVEP